MGDGEQIPDPVGICVVCEAPASLYWLTQNGRLYRVCNIHHTNVNKDKIFRTQEDVDLERITRRLNGKY